MNTHIPFDDETIILHTNAWLEKAVIGLNLCPFAKAPYVKGQIRIAVSHAKHLDGFLEDLDRELQLLLEKSPQELETTLLVHPTLFPDFLVFNDVLDIAEATLSDNQAEGIIQIVPFHPDFQFANTDADDISNYTNRSPYPTLHLIRENSITKATEAFPDPSVIFERNIKLLQEMGQIGWDKLNIPRCPFSHEKPS
ncbi:MAG: DUF1415 domain-containing protein [Alysiella sp.]|uniref:DUF1415 domain-containing protein n=1 Tax=Alysiella sp. TaxID=1872483 RepID=UPI0026DAC21B|nr:DUF1415 domain-containing protein [Alysiella sp.]MDO4433380.1 DUF1415 domain-containing protein [Alysiella sp.]